MINPATKHLYVVRAVLADCAEAADDLEAALTSAERVARKPNPSWRGATGKAA